MLTALEGIDPAARSARDSGANPLERLARGVFVGREAGLERLRTAFDEAFSGRGQVVMLVGEPGIGKTRTAQELETYARMRGAQVLWGRARESAGAPPYWPWVQVGRAYGGSVAQELLLEQLGSGAVELQRLFPDLRDIVPDLPDPPPVESDVAQFRLFDAFAGFLRGVSEQTPLAIMLDDLHWADQPTLLLLQHLAEELGRTRILVVGTYRDTELARTHPLSASLAELNRGEGFLRVPLRGLERDEVESYIRAAANLEPARELVDRIHEETEDNPFFLSEVVNLMAAEGTLTADSLSDIQIPDGVREALGRRLDRLSEEANELLTVASVVGREFEYDTLKLLAEHDDEALLQLVEEGLAGRVIEELPEAGRYRFTHALMQETLLAELSTTRRVRLHGRVAETLERVWVGRAEERASRLAHHFLESATLNREHAERAARYSRLAGEQAEAQTAWAEAARHYGACVTLLDESGDGLGEDEAALLTALGHCQGLEAEYRPAWRSLVRAVDLYRERGDWAGQARAVIAAGRAHPPFERLVSLISATLEAPGERDPALEARLMALRAFALQVMGRTEEGDPDSEAAARLAERHDVEDVRGALVYRAGFQALDLGHLREASDLLREAFEELRAASDPVARGAGFSAAGALHEAGALEAARVGYEAALRHARETHDRFWEQNLLSRMAVLELLRAEPVRARALAEEIVGAPNIGRYAPLLGSAEFEGAVDPAEHAPPLEIAGGVANFLILGRGLRARAWLDAGDEEAARTEVAEWGELARSLPAGFLRSGLGFHGPALAAVGDGELVRWVYERLEPVEELRVLGWSSADAVRGGLALRLDLVDEAEQHFRTGLEWCERERCPVEAGRCLEGLAEVAERRGEHAEAMEYLDRAGELFSRHGAKLYLDQVLAKKEILKA